jgi:aspartyl/asparaginyl beta-hydroxylase (cupin superfamily)
LAVDGHLARASNDLTQLDRAAAQAANEGRWDDADRIWMEMRGRAPNNRNALWGLGYSALQRGDASKARLLLLAAQKAAPQDKVVLLTLAVACRECKDTEGEKAALASALTLDPRNLQALLAKGALLERIGHADTAAAYASALQVAPPLPQNWPQEFRAQLERAKEVSDRHRQGLFKALSDRVSDMGDDMSAAQRARWGETASIMANITTPFYSAPHKLLVPRLASIPFHDRTLFPWLEEFEAKTALIRDELMRALAVKNEGFVPYVALQDSASNQWSELNHSKRWSVLYLWQNGVRNEENLALCPETAKALDLVDQAYIRGNCPNAMFSALAPKTHIPPHCGESNARLVVHLPLVVPENCGSLRVGYDQREWKVGEALIFDDSIEHEARNNSDELRVVLLFDVWNPHLTAQEREMVNALVTTSANFRG